MSKALEKLQEGLHKYNLDNIKGSPFDNAFEVFESAREDINLVVVGTNGNITDSIKTNSEWLNERARNPAYSHVSSGDWGKTPLQSELLKIPAVLNTCYTSELFSPKNMIVTNALLLASSGVADIKTQFEILRESSDTHKSLRDLVKASLNFFNDYTLYFAAPKIIFSYGNSDSNDSAWGYLRKHYKTVRSIDAIAKTKGSSYKFCTLDINNKETTIIGSPHLSYHYNSLDGALIKEGLAKLGSI